jgi:hypothetical protein
MSTFGETPAMRWFNSLSEGQRSLVIEASYANMIAFTPLVKPISLEPAPAVKGQIGEKQVEDLLRRKFDDSTNIENVAKKTGSGDIILQFGSKKMIIEIKNYKSAVRSDEVIKFHRDLELTSADCGLFISLTSPISNIDLLFSLKCEVIGERMIPIIYLSSPDENLIVTSVNMLRDFVSYTDKMMSGLYSDDKFAKTADQMTSAMTSLARVRDGIQRAEMERAVDINKTIVKIGNIEASLCSAAEAISRSVYDPKVVTSPGEISDAINAGQYAPAQKAYVSEIIDIVNKMEHSEYTAGGWKVAAKKIVHVESKIGFKLALRKISVFMPTTFVTPNYITALIRLLPKKINIDENITIELDESTYSLIRTIITKSEEIENIGRF